MKAQPEPMSYGGSKPWREKDESLKPLFSVRRLNVRVSRVSRIQEKLAGVNHP